MRSINSKFKTNFMSESGTLLQNKDYFAFVELDDYACYVIADGIDDDLELHSAQIAVTSIIRSFTEKPTMKKHVIKKYLMKANEDLVLESKYVRLKASITVVVTDYSKLVYALAGNTRFYLFRGGAVRYKSEDQSLTQILANKEELTIDKISCHMERNNLYCYLGQNNLNKPYISKKIKLMDGDVISLLTRGIWENIEEQDLLESVNEGKDPEEVLNHIEDLLLSKQLSNIENYTAAFTFIDKVYVQPKKNEWIKKVLIAAIPILILLIIFLIIWKINNNKKVDSINEMKAHKVNAVEYTQNGNMPRAGEEIKEALKIATKYKVKPDKDVIDKHSKFIELLLDADGKMKDKKYDEALDNYLLALDKSDTLDGLGKKYILDKLEIARNSIKVADLLTLGDKDLEVGNVAEAEVAYKQARNIATDLYLKDERKEAMDKLAKLSDKKAADQKQAKDDEDKKKKEEEDKKKEKEDKEKEKVEVEAKAIENLKKADMSYVAGDYTSAKMYYIMAKQLYEQINSEATVADLQEKIVLMDRKINEVSSSNAQAEKYGREGDEKYIKGDYGAAKVLYNLASDLYQKDGNSEGVKKIKEKLDLVEKATATKQ